MDIRELYASLNAQIEEREIKIESLNQDIEAEFVKQEPNQTRLTELINNRIALREESFKCFEERGELLKYFSLHRLQKPAWEGKWFYSKKLDEVGMKTPFDQWALGFVSIGGLGYLVRQFLVSQGIRKFLENPQGEKSVLLYLNFLMKISSEEVIPL